MRRVQDTGRFTQRLNELRTIGLATLLRCPNAAVFGSLATWVWMAAGAGWLTAHRLGLEPLDFDRAITLLTVAYFNVAGLGLTALLAVTHRRRLGRTLLAAIWLHQAGMLTVAALGPFIPEPVVTTFKTMLRYHAALQTFGLVL